MKQTTTKPARKPVKPRRYWAYYDPGSKMGCSTIGGKRDKCGFTRPVLVIDLSPASVEALVAISGRAICPEADGELASDFLEDAKASLAAIGIVAKGGKR